MIVLFSKKFFSKSKKKEFFVPQVAKVSKLYTLHFNQFEGRKDRCTRIERKIAAACKQILFERNKRIRIRREVQFYFPPILFPPLSPFYLSFFRTAYSCPICIWRHFRYTLTACSREKYRDCTRPK